MQARGSELRPLVLLQEPLRDGLEVPPLGLEVGSLGAVPLTPEGAVPPEVVLTELAVARDPDDAGRVGGGADLQAGVQELVRGERRLVVVGDQNLPWSEDGRSVVILLESTFILLLR